MTQRLIHDRVAVPTIVAAAFPELWPVEHDIHDVTKLVFRCIVAGREKKQNHIADLSGVELCVRFRLDHGVEQISFDRTARRFPLRNQGCGEIPETIEALLYLRED